MKRILFLIFYALFYIIAYLLWAMAMTFMKLKDYIIYLIQALKAVISG